VSTADESIDAIIAGLLPDAITLAIAGPTCSFKGTSACSPPKITIG